MSKVTVDATRLRSVLSDGMVLDAGVQQELVDEIAEAAIEWMLELKGPTISAPGEGLWPVGNILNLGQSNERYVSESDPRGRDSGRSLGAWDIDQQGLNLTATNDAVDANRNNYSEYVHFGGDPVGQAVEDAEEKFVEIFDAAAERMADIIERELLGAG